MFVRLQRIRCLVLCLRILLCVSLGGVYGMTLVYEHMRCVSCGLGKACVPSWGGSGCGY